MKFLKIMKDGGKESKVWGLFLVEIKRLFSVAVLRFAHGSREAYHSHAFNAVSWVLKGSLLEHHLDGRQIVYFPSFKPVITKRNVFHMVVSDGNTYVFTLRGPWAQVWQEFLPATNEFVQLTHGRKVVE